jgi:hypothetical protein
MKRDANAKMQIFFRYKFLIKADEFRSLEDEQSWENLHLVWIWGKNIGNEMLPLASSESPIVQISI